MVGRCCWKWFVLPKSRLHQREIEEMWVGAAGTRHTAVAGFCWLVVPMSCWKEQQGSCCCVMVSLHESQPSVSQLCAG